MHRCILRGRFYFSVPTQLDQLGRHDRMHVPVGIGVIELRVTEPSSKQLRVHVNTDVITVLHSLISIA